MRVIPDGNVGIGTTTPDKKLCVREATSSLRFSHEGGPAVLRVENSAAASLTALNLGNNARNWQLRVEGTDGNKFKVFDATAIADRLTIDTAGNLGIGTRNPQRTLDIAAARGSTEFVIRDDSQPLDQRAWRLMNNSQLLAIEAVNDALTGGTNVMNFTRDGLVGIATKSTQYALHLKTGWGILGLDTQAVNQHSGIRLHENGAVKWHVWNDGSATGNRLNINSATGLGMQIAQDGTAGFGRDIRLENPNGATIYGRARLHVHGEELLYVLNKAGVVIGKEWGGNGDLRVQGNLSVQGIAGVGTWAPEKARLAVSETRRLPAVLGSSPQRGVHGIGGGEATVSLNTDVAGVYGTSTSGVGVFGVSSSLYPGVEGGGTGQSNIGVRAIAYSSSGYGLQAENTSGGYAGLFLGHVQIRGNIQATGTKAFLIDHPLDPANMYLQHFALESPDMLCVYNGNVTTDEQGTATVVLPAYLHTLNHEFRYQVTVLGQSAQAIVEREIEDNQFSIKTDKPNVKVSWQVTGVRRDPYAEANRTPVEVAKPDEERGRYLQPELYDADEASSIPSGLGIAPLLMDGEHQGT